MMVLNLFRIRSSLPRINVAAIVSFRTYFRTIDVPFNPQPPAKKKERRKNRPSRPAYRFVDQIRLRAVAGSGGQGSQSMFTLRQAYKRKPDGGHGGRGGHVILLADPKQKSLRSYKSVAIAESGVNGMGNDMHGKAGRNLVIRVPCGVIVKRVLAHDEVWDPSFKMVRKIAPPDEPLPENLEGDKFERNYNYDPNKETDDVDIFAGAVFNHDDDTNQEVYSDDDDDYSDDDDDDDEEIETPRGKQMTIIERPEEDIDYDHDEEIAERERVTLVDLDKPGAWYAVARGGKGGQGNCSFKSRHGPLPEQDVIMKRAMGEKGETAYLELVLKMIADLGLVGFPNAGKSSFLSAMSRATPHIAPYPFTTLHPLMGVIEYRDGIQITAADIPGLVAGASEGRGRGHDFLRHIERTKALMYIVDSGGTDGRDPVEDLRVLVDELGSYEDGDLLNKHAIVAANKVDLISQSQRESLLFELGLVAEEAGIRFNGEVVGISAGVTGEGLGDMSRIVREVVEKQEKEERLIEELKSA